MPRHSCRKCKRLKAEDAFYRNKQTGKLRSWCKECCRDYECARYGKDFRKKQIKARVEVAKKRNQERMWSYLMGHPCVDCGENDPIVLEFDHLSPREGRCVASMLSNAFSWQAIEREIAKCDVVCANCHSRRTLRRAGSWKLAMSKKGKHGTPVPVLRVQASHRKRAKGRKAD